MPVRKILFKVLSESNRDEKNTSTILKWLTVIDDIVIGVAVLANVFCVIFFPEVQSLALFFTLFFVAEYLLKIWAASYKYVGSRLLRYALTNGRLLDFLLSFPALFLFLWVELGGNTGSLKLTLAIRLLYVFRVLKIGRTFQFAEKLLFQVRKLAVFLITAYLMIFCLAILAGALAYYFEGPAQPEKFTSMGDALWWAITTLSTTGYGDLYPVTTAGRIIGGFTMALGNAFYAIPLAIMSGAVRLALVEQEEEIDKVEERLKEVERKVDLIVDFCSSKNKKGG